MKSSDLDVYNDVLAAHSALPSSTLPTHALEPESLDAWAIAAEAALLRQGESDNTQRSYRSALRYWSAWHTLRYQRPIALPVPVPTVVQFIVDHAERLDTDGQAVTELPPGIDAALVAGGFKGKLGTLALSTLVHRIAVLSKAHQAHPAHQAANPCEMPRVRELVARARRGSAKRGALPRKKPALTREPLEALLATCDDSLVGQRDKALLLFAFSSGGRRRSEVTAATVENTLAVDGGFVFTLAQSKGNQSGQDRPENAKPIAGRAAEALRAWLASSKIRSGAIFRRVRRGGVVAEPLAPGAVRDIVKKRCALAGLDDAFSAHSLRSGFVTEAGRQGVPLGETMALTGHRSTSSLVGYFRQAGLKSKGARLLDEPPPD